MSGLKYLLDTNIIIGLLKQSQPVITYLNQLAPALDECAYSAITRMELLGFPSITEQEEHAIQQVLDAMQYLALDQAIEDLAIQLRRTSGLKLPDAIIAATALMHQLTLLTLDDKLQKVLTQHQV